MSGDPSAVATEIRADVAHALVAVDFDGTLAPIVPDPAD
jgi:trehalose-6-phosphatase